MNPVALAILGAVFVQAASAGNCRPEARFPIEPDWYGGPTVSLTVGGQSMALLVDTGGVKSMLTQSTTKRLGLQHYPITDSVVTLYGGAPIQDYVRLPPGELMPAEFYVMPDNHVPYALSGTLAPDVLSRYDVAFDFAKAEMTLYPSGECPVADGLRLTRDNANHVITTVEIDGRHLPAFLDTGASRSEMSYETARRLFWKTASAAPARRADTEDGVFVYPFEALTIGKVKVGMPDIVLVPDTMAKRPDSAPRLLLGMNILRRMKLFIAYSRGRIAIEPAESN